MDDKNSLTRANRKTPRVTAVAGILFAVLTVSAFTILRTSLPADPKETGAWLGTNSRTVALGINLLPFAGVAFLWFIGVLRDRLGIREDRFFATVFLGSGLLFLAMMFAAAAIIGAIIVTFSAAPNTPIDASAFHVARALAYNIVNVYMIKIAAVFTVALSTVALQTKIAARWLAIVGYVIALVMLFGSERLDWAFLAFPVWIFMVSVNILIDNYRSVPD